MTRKKIQLGRKAAAEAAEAGPKAPAAAPPAAEDDPGEPDRATAAPAPSAPPASAPEGPHARLLARLGAAGGEAAAEAAQVIAHQDELLVRLVKLADWSATLVADSTLPSHRYAAEGWEQTKRAWRDMHEEIKKLMLAVPARL
jgi:hypothetical protein